MHGIAAAVAVWALWQQPGWLAVAEVGLAVSLALGVFLVGRLVRTASFSRDSRQWLADGDFMTRFQRVGQPEIDAQIDLYNRMIDDLRAARVAAEEQQQFLVQVMEASPAGMIVLDYDGRVVAINPAGVRLVAGAARGRRGSIAGRSRRAGAAAPRRRSQPASSGWSRPATGAGCACGTARSSTAGSAAASSRSRN